MGGGGGGGSVSAVSLEGVTLEMMAEEVLP